MIKRSQTRAFSGLPLPCHTRSQSDTGVRITAILAVVLLSSLATLAADTPPSAGKFALEMETVRQRLQGGTVLLSESFAGMTPGPAWIAEEGNWQTGRARGDAADGIYGTPGTNYPDSFLWTTNVFRGDIAVEFDAECVSEPANDINFIIGGKSPNYPPPEASLYLFGIGGWGNTRSGVERAPDYKWKMLTGRFTIQPRQTYHVLAGRLGSVLYLFIDGELVIEARDPDPLPAEGQFAFHVYNSTVRFRNLAIRMPLRISPAKTRRITR